MNALLYRGSKFHTGSKLEQALVLYSGFWDLRLLEDTGSHEVGGAEADGVEEGREVAALRGNRLFSLEPGLHPCDVGQDVGILQGFLGHLDVTEILLLELGAT